MKSAGTLDERAETRVTAHGQVLKVGVSTNRRDGSDGPPSESHDNGLLRRFADEVG
jgi:hypothetical protein